MIIGFILYLIINSIVYVIIQTILPWFCLLIIFCLSLIWELIENFVFIRFEIKFGNRRDSLFNSATDMLFFFFGGAYASLMSLLERSFIIVYILAFLYGTTFVMALYAYIIIIKKK